MHRKFIRLLSLLLLNAVLIPSLSAQVTGCNYVLIMEDVYGDGWNGGVLTIASGASSTNFTLSTGDSDTISFNVTNGAPLVATWTGGSYVYEVSYTILNNVGQVISQVNAPNMPSSGVVFSGTGVCVTCSPPVNLLVENVWDTYAKLRWGFNANGPNPPVQYKVVYGPQGFDIDAGEGDTAATSVSKITLTGLQKKTWYDAYVIQDCGAAGGLSERTGPVSFETYWTKDVGISGVISPVSSCNLGLDTVRVLLKNYGAAPQSLIPFRYTVNGEEVNIPKPADGFYTGVLGKDSAEVVLFETLYDFSEPGEYVIVAYTKYSADEDVSNDTFTYRINNRLVAPYKQSFEDWNGGWQVVAANGVPSWQYGAPEKASIPAAGNGQFCWVSSLTNNYNANELSYLESPCFDFTELALDPAISFLLNHDLESGYDAGWLEISTNDGLSWNKVGAIDEGLNWYNEDVTDGTMAGEAWSDISNGWVPARHFLTGAAGESNVRIRFAINSDQSVQKGGLGIDSIRIFPAFAKDLAGVKVNAESDQAECGLQNDHVTFTFFNAGNVQQANLKVAYSINGGTPVIENVSGGLNPDAVRVHTFNVTFDSRDAVSVIKCWTLLSGDFAPANDTATLVLNHVAKPLPFQEDFEDQAVPAGWVTDGVISNSHGNTSYVLAVNIYSFNNEETTELPRYGVVGANDSLTFSYRITNFSGGGPAVLGLGTKVETQVSTDCGETYETINTVNSTNHTPTLNMRTRTISLAQFAGQNIKIRFVSTWSSGDLWVDMDNINVISCAADMGISADVTPASPGQSNGSATVNVALGNPPYKYSWSNGATEQTATGLSSGAYTVTVLDAHGCSGVYEFSVGTSAASEPEGLKLFRISPNPTTGLAAFKVAFDRNVDDVRLEALNLLGQAVWSMNAGQTSGFDGQIDLDAFPNGIYLVRLIADGQVLTRKVVKQDR